jgi:hypothetical protein
MRRQRHIEYFRSAQWTHSFRWEDLRGPRRLIRVGQPVYIRFDGTPSVWCRSAVYRFGEIETLTPSHVVVTFRGGRGHEGRE